MAQVLARLVVEAGVTEPILQADDIEIWDRWMLTAETHAKTRAFARRVDSAKRVLEAGAAHQPASVSWSGGKDSTAVVHLACVEMGMGDVYDVRSEKDDLDFPGEREYVERLGAAWGLRLRVYEPPVSLVAYMDERAGRMSAGDDIHSRRSDLSKRFFYPLTREMDEGLELVVLGLRSGESAIRRGLRERRGRLYQLASGTWRALPIADWSGLDVFAYIASRGIEILPVYRCVGLMHASEPWRIRKSWWVPGSSAQDGKMAWLRRYYPSLYARAARWFPDIMQVS